MGNRTSSTKNLAAAATGNQTYSTHRSAASAGVHLFRIKGHSLIERSGQDITSKPFQVGGYDWTIRYSAGGQHTSVFLCLESAREAQVTASCSFSCLQDPSSSPTTTQQETNKICFTQTFSSKAKSWGPLKFMSKADAAGCLVIKCAVEVITKELSYDADQEDGNGVFVPSSELTQQLGNLLESGDAADITVDVGEVNKRFRAHRCVLTARSPVFRAMLCGSMTESKENTIIRIEDMEAGVFEVLLHYMYHDDLPVFMKDDMCSAEEASNMAQHVLVAADRYGMERLKLICESILSKTMDANTVCSTLGFANQRNCEQLKNCCLTYMLRDRERLKVIVETEGFRQLRQKCGFSFACEVFVKSLEITPPSHTMKFYYYKKYAPIFVAITFLVMLIIIFYVL